MNKRIIINADDCGMSETMDREIEYCIQNGVITSSTIMANMDDFDGAVRLYKQYKDQISFGWHMNLTEGKPLMESQVLLDRGYYLEDNGVIVMNGKPFWKKVLSRDMVHAIKKELKAQYEKIRDNGIEITHADSHEHIHTSWGLWPYMPGFLHELGITRCRRMRNYVPSSLSRMARGVWTLPFKARGIRMVDTFCSFKEYMDNPSLPNGRLLELECHPGSKELDFEEEYKILKQKPLTKAGVELINYNDL